MIIFYLGGLNMNKYNFLLIEDSQTDADILLWNFKKKGIDIIYTRVEKEDELMYALLEKKFDLILSDYNMPCMDPLTACSICNKFISSTPFIIYSAFVPDYYINALSIYKINKIFLKDDFDKLYKYVLNLQFV